jgi:hypothetical protein
MSPKINKTEILMKAQALNPAESKTLLIYLTSSCSTDDLFVKSLHAGLESIQKRCKRGVLMPAVELKLQCGCIPGVKACPESIRLWEEYWKLYEAAVDDIHPKPGTNRWQESEEAKMRYFTHYQQEERRQ